jgi:NAD(P)-dependent dehydrogenase (short-subunit alcohol dehydrogenase family)
VFHGRHEDEDDVMPERRTAVITGGASGIGRGIALRLARDGADVALLDLDAAGAEQVAAEVSRLGRRALAVEVDVASAASVAAAVERVHAGVGPVHVLVNDAGIASFLPLLQMPEADWDRMIAVHLKGTFNCTRAVLPDMVAAGWGRVVSISSVAGLRGGPGLAHYSAAKAGIIGFTKAVAQEVGGLGITVNAIAPGLIDTPLLRRSAMPEAFIAALVHQTPVGRIGTPEDIAAVCAYLVSDEASFFTGQVVSPNGGAHL